MIPRCVLVIVAAFGIGTFPSWGYASGAHHRARRSAQTTSSSQPRVADQACFAAFRGAEMHVQAGELRAAKERLLACAQTICARFLQQQCSQRYSQLEPEIPSVIPLVIDEDGEPRSDIVVTVDGQPLASRIDGRAFLVDPGSHTFTFTAAGGVLARHNVTILQGQRNRAIEVSLKSAAKAPKRVSLAPLAPPSEVTPGEGTAHARRTRRQAARDAANAAPVVFPTPAVSSTDQPAAAGRSTVLTYAVAGLGLGALAAGGLLTYWGRADNDRLGQCSPTCPPAAVDHVRHMYLGANIAFGVGAAALAAATWSYLRAGRSQDQPSQAPPIRVDLHAGTSGAVVALKGTF